MTSETTGRVEPWANRMSAGADIGMPFCAVVPG